MAKITPIDIIKGVSVVETSPFELRSFSVRESKNERRMNEE